MLYNQSFLPTADSQQWSIQEYSLISPYLHSRDRAGHPFLIHAHYTIQDAPYRYRFALPVAYLERTDGILFKATSQEGRYNQQTETLHLQGKVRLANTQHYTIHTENAAIHMRTKDIDSHHPVSGQGPLGSFRGSGFSLSKERLVLRGPSRITLKAELFQKRAR